MFDINFNSKAYLILYLFLFFFHILAPQAAYQSAPEAHHHHHAEPAPQQGYEAAPVAQPAYGAAFDGQQGYGAGPVAQQTYAAAPAPVQQSYNTAPGTFSITKICSYNNRLMCIFSFFLKFQSMCINISCRYYSLDGIK